MWGETSGQARGVKAKIPEREGWRDKAVTMQ
jgi:hypothetical protein